MFFGLILIAIGVIALLVKLGVLNGSVWDYTWPVIIIALGISILSGWRRQRTFWRRWHWPPEEEEKK